MTRPLLVLGLGAVMVLASMAKAWSDIPTILYGPTAFTASGSMPVVNLSGQSTCAMTLSGSGSATITPKGSSDNGATYVTVGTIGAQTANGTYGGAVAPYLTNFYVAVSGVSGTVNVSESCSVAVTSSGATPAPVPANLYVLHGKVNAGSISAGVVKGGTFSVAENSTGFTPTWNGTTGTLSITVPAAYAAQKMFFDVRSSLAFTAITGGTAGSITYYNGLGADVTDPTQCTSHVESVDLGTFNISCLNSGILYNAGDGPITVQFNVAGTTASISGTVVVQFDMLAVPV